MEMEVGERGVGGGGAEEKIEKNFRERQRRRSCPSEDGKGKKSEDSRKTGNGEVPFRA